MTASLAAGYRVELDHVGLFADGAAIKLVGAGTFRIAHAPVDGMITVSTDETCAAIKSAFEDTRYVPEPAGALAPTGLCKHVESLPAQASGSTFVVIASGANMDFDRLHFISERAATGRSEARLSLKIPERPAVGAFRELHRLAFPCNATELSYRLHRKDAPADVIMAFKPRTVSWMMSWIALLSDAGYSPSDITADGLDTAHVRHLAEGHAQSAEKERVFGFEFPEAPGAPKYISRGD